MTSPDTTTALWPQLLSSALVGTDRRPCAPDAVPQVLAEAVPAGPLDPDGLLTAAAVVTVARRAGQRPAQVEAPAPAPAETARYAPAAAQQRLGRLLSGSEAELDRQVQHELLGEWLRLAAGRDLLAAPQHLVALLEQADSSQRQLVRAVGGARLQWLCAEGLGRWSWAMTAPEAAPGAEDWETGRIEARAAHLARLRGTDPAAGRDLLAEAWPQEKAADLAALIEACATGLGLDDEPWLEKALDDRRTQIREAAARLLGQLPGSAYRQRMADRALACVEAVKARRLEVTPPAECDAGMRRDGIVAKPPTGTGERAHWLAQIIAAAPLDCWAAIDADPAAVLNRKASDDWGPVVRKGLARAAVAQRDGGWAKALLYAGFTDAGELHAQLVAVLPPDELAETVARHLRRNVDSGVRLLPALPDIWPAVVCEAVLEALRDRERSSGLRYQLLRRAETGLDPAYAPRLAALLDDVPQLHVQVLARLHTIIAIRHDIHREFA
ncbi:DUF5691 domain-containing protein [Catellatospora sp. KI3]|uniref:DUF5691 domain-containing protein n=1 Tax=Catellatospora sp. KI3 TaxID=3041620 RepID=UPI00248244DF|nr:DUF5691 domain-containing protein [Catellatospora sp. KI3]MDI1462170.1 DUF5691 domain-containing protein [Catellatospora sp. KI3]